MKHILFKKVRGWMINKKKYAYNLDHTSIKVFKYNSVYIYVGH
uniref:Uncharacterized protein n=1 Tax=Ciona intestinalis TaxID=7719 RepID=H2XM89_CIOIN